MFATGQNLRDDFARVKQNSRTSDETTRCENTRTSARCSLRVRLRFRRKCARQCKEKEKECPKGILDALVEIQYPE